jgi:hypothetical protein
VVEEELGVGGSNTIIHNGTSGWEDVEEEDEDLAHLKDIENGHPMEGIEERAVITVSNWPALLKILLTVARISKPLPLPGSKKGGKRPLVPVWGSSSA